MTRAAARRNLAARILFVLATVCVTMAGLVGSASADGDTVYVRPGQSIQKAINRADPGDRIIVRAGTYAEQLTVNKNGIELVGRGADPHPAILAGAEHVFRLGREGHRGGNLRHGQGRRAGPVRHQADGAPQVRVGGHPGERRVHQRFPGPWVLR